MNGVLVIGGGVVGVSSAYALARRGLAVTLIEAEAGPGRGTSFANGAQLSYAYTDAFASPGLLNRLPSIIAGADPAIRIAPRFDPDFLRWGLRFLAECTGTRFEANTLAGLRLGMQSRLAMEQLIALHPLDFGHDVPGKLLLYERENAFRSARQLAQQRAFAGAEQQAVSRAEAVEIEPALAPIAWRLAGAIWSPKEAIGDPHRFCTELLAILTDSYAVHARLGSRVSRIIPGARPAALLADGEVIHASHIIICTGAQAPLLLRTMGLAVPILPVRGHSITAPPGPCAPKVSITDTSRKLVFCPLGESIRIAGQADVGVCSSAVSERRLRQLVSSARESLPDTGDYQRISSSWAGLRPVTPNSLPVVQRHEGVTINVGHGGLGWTYAMGTAELAARLVTGESR